jgi:DNA-directed RNA polymerase specialized sigma24 family protein
MMALEFRSQLIKPEENLMRFAYSLTGNNEDTEDLEQGTILKALTCCDKSEDVSNLKS